MLVLGIDPGRCTAWAFVDAAKDELLRAGVDPIRKLFPVPLDVSVVIEKPVIYPHAKEDPNDLITLAINVGEYLELFRAYQVTLVEARTWKGQVPKSVTEKRVCAHFPNAEGILKQYPQSVKHNVSDAIGLAWWGAKRLAWWGAKRV